MQNDAPLRRGPLMLVVGLLLVAATTTFANDETSLANMKKDIFYLASDECEGRGIDTQGINKAADHIAAELKKAGLKPGGVNGTYFQPFPVTIGKGKVAGDQALTLRGPQGQTIALAMGEHFQTLPMSGSGKVTAPIVFAGYGVTSAAANYDDYKDLDVKGKIVVVLRRVPRFSNDAVPFGGTNQAKTALAGLATKLGLAEANRAAAIIFVNDATEVAGGDKFETLEVSSAGVPIVHLKRSVLDMIMMSVRGQALQDVENDIDRDLKPRSGALQGWTATVQTTVQRQSYACKNIIAYVDGAGPLADEIVVVGAHYDHWGYGGAGSLAKDKGKKQIHPGADDNGSGSTSVLELARRIAQIKNRQGRKIVFMWYSAEERGLLGSRHFCNKEPLFALEKVVAMVNLDMVGRLKDDKKLKAEGLGTGKGFEQLVDKFNEDFGFVLQKKQSGLGPSDHDSFCRKKIPVLFFWTGIHEDYHRPTDTADKINLPGMLKIAQFAEKCILHFASVEKRPEFVAMGDSGAIAGGTGPKMRLQIDYGDESNTGVYIDGVPEDGPAAKGGIKPGDCIVAIAGQPTPNVNAYMAVMSQQLPGVPLQVTVHRAGKALNLTVVPQ